MPMGEYAALRYKSLLIVVAWASGPGILIVKHGRDARATAIRIPSSVHLLTALRIRVTPLTPHLPPPLQMKMTQRHR